MLSWVQYFWDLVGIANTNSNQMCRLVFLDESECEPTTNCFKTANFTWLYVPRADSIIIIINTQSP